MNRKERLIRKQQRMELVSGKKATLAMATGIYGGGGLGAALGYGAGRLLKGGILKRRTAALYGGAAGMVAGLGAAGAYTIKEDKRIRDHALRTAKAAKIRGYKPSWLWAPAYQLRRHSGEAHPYINFMQANMSHDLKQGTFKEAWRGFGSDIRSVFTRKSKKGARRHRAV